MKYALIILVTSTITFSAYCQPDPDHDRPSRELNFKEGEKVEGMGHEHEHSEKQGNQNPERPERQPNRQPQGQPATLPAPPSKMSPTTRKLYEELVLELKKIKGIQTLLTGSPLLALITGDLNEQLGAIALSIPHKDWADLAEAIKQLSESERNTIEDYAMSAGLLLDDDIKAKREKNEDVKELQDEEKFWEKMLKSASGIILNPNFLINGGKYKSLAYVDGKVTARIFEATTEIAGTKDSKKGIRFYPKVSIYNCINKRIYIQAEVLYSEDSTFSIANEDRTYSIKKHFLFNCNSNPDGPIPHNDIFIPYEDLRPYPKSNVKYYILTQIKVFEYDDLIGKSKWMFFKINPYHSGAFGA